MKKSWQQQLEADQIVLIDGATGTELQRRGIPMDKVAWSGAGALQAAMRELEAARSA